MTTKENSIRFHNADNLRSLFESAWEGAIEDGEDRPPLFVCKACGESKPFDEMRLAVEVEGSQGGICYDCYRSFHPPSVARQIFNYQPKKPTWRK
jgi:hypothetical protein